MSMQTPRFERGEYCIHLSHTFGGDLWKEECMIEEVWENGVYVIRYANSEHTAIAFEWELS